MRLRIALCLSLITSSWETPLRVWAAAAAVAPVEAPLSAGGASAGAGAQASTAANPLSFGSLGLAAPLGLAEPESASALDRVLQRIAENRPELSPQALSLLDSAPAREQAVRAALGAYTESLLERSQYPDGSGLDALAFDAGRRSARLESFDAELRDMRLIIGVLPRSRGLEVLDRAARIRALLQQDKTQRAEERVAELKKAWGLDVPRSPEDWASFYGVVEGSLSEADFRERTDAFLLGRQEILSAAKDSPNLSLLQWPLARYMIGEREKENQLRRWMVAQAPTPAAQAQTGADPALRGKDQELLAALQPLVPGLDPARFVIGDEGWTKYRDDGHAYSGWATQGGVTAVARREDRLRLIEVAIHEGFHQGDHGYDVAFAALQLLLGRRGGSALDKMLVEGYTEYRTEELMLLMLRRGYEGGGGIEAELVGLAERAHGTRGYAATAEAMRRAFASQPYGPFVALVRALLRQDGGEAMLAAFVARGDVSPLVQGLGARRWTLIAQLAELYGRYSDRADKQQSHFTEASGLGAWLAGKMADVVEGNTASREEIERIRRTAEDFLAAARDAYAGFSPSRRFELLGVLAGFDFDSSADVGAEIAARIRAREAVGPAHRVQAVLLAAALSLLTAAGVFGLQPQDVSPPWQSLPLWVGVVQLAASLVLLHLWPVYVAARGGMQFMLRFLPSSPIDTRRPS